MNKPWYGVDFDGTLAHYDGGLGLGKPIPKMVERVKQWLAQGKEVKIVTARADDGEMTLQAIRLWCRLVLGKELDITNKKDYNMLELWDDRAVQVVPNTGERADGKP